MILEAAGILVALIGLFLGLGVVASIGYFVIFAWWASSTPKVKKPVKYLDD